MPSASPRAPRSKERAARSSSWRAEIMANNPIGNLWKIPELKEKILFTLLCLFVYRAGAHITAPGIDVTALEAQFKNLSGTLFGVYDMFVGGALARATILSLGIMP